MKVIRNKKRGCAHSGSPSFLQLINLEQTPTGNTRSNQKGNHINYLY